jgi:phosphopantothenoylcysteine decarboxylase/phosphopantothenate--cysteine ligase
MAHGLADDLLTCILLATGASVMLAPSMETRMYEHFAVQNNLRRLRQAGCEILEPDVGELASGQHGVGRLPRPDRIVAAVKARLEKHNALKGRKIVVTASRTEEDIDPVRFLTNRSTGKMGYAVASQARRRGADVVLVSGPTTLDAPADVDVVAVRTVCEMRDATVAAFQDADALIMAAAVLDFKPKRVAGSKIKKGGNGLRLDLEPTEDILSNLGPRKGKRMLVGFAVETENGLANARKKLKAKNLDLIVLNDITVEGAGFGVDTNQVTLVDRSEQVERLPKMTKVEAADRILNWIGGQWT